MTATRTPIAAGAFLALLLSHAPAAESPNSAILRAIEKMPSGGGYATTTQAHQRLAAAFKHDGSALELQPSQAQPSYCSGATYLVFAKVLKDYAAKGEIHLGKEALDAILVRGQPDGVGVWGRWNANGPGTARLFAETGLGKNFLSWSDARPGDFMKIWWTTEIGKLERGHSVVFLGTEQVDGKEHVRFWSSNKPAGFGEKSVPRAEVAWAVFSRLERPGRASRLADLPKRDVFLASMLKHHSTREDVKAQCEVVD